jgi:hypothetical protein
MKNPETHADPTHADPMHPMDPYTEPKHPDVIEGTPEEKAQLARNIVALRPQQVVYMKITAYSPIETDASATFLSAVDAFEMACQTAKVDMKFDVTVTPPSEATVKRDADRAKRQAEKREADKREAEESAKARAVAGARP